MGLYTLKSYLFSCTLVVTGSHVLCGSWVHKFGRSLGPIYFAEFGYLYLEGLLAFPHFGRLLALIYFEGYLNHIVSIFHYLLQPKALGT